MDLPDKITSANCDTTAVISTATTTNVAVTSTINVTTNVSTSTTNNDNHNNNSNEFDKSLSNHTTHMTNYQKVRRLKVLQELEDRKLQLNRERLTKAQIKLLKQLDFQRSQFTRRFSESNLIPILLEDLPEEITITEQNNNLSSSNSKFKNSINDENELQSKSITNECSNYNTTTYTPISTNTTMNSTNDNLGSYVDHPFWLRLPSLGIVPDDDLNLTSLANNKLNLEDNSQNKTNENNLDKIKKSSNDSMRISRSNNRRISQRTTSVIDVLNTNDSINCNLVKRASISEDRTPSWLISLYQMKREKLSRSDINKREELAALVSGNKVCPRDKCCTSSKNNNAISIMSNSDNKCSEFDNQIRKQYRHSVVGLARQKTSL